MDLTRLGPWANLPVFAETLPGIEAALNAEPRPWLPARDRVFAALEACPPEATRVIILGQDPYPTPGHAHGLAFSVEPGVRPLPKSLANIFREMTDDLGACPPNGDLRFWARQGVLLLNTVLTVPAGDANGHTKLGWQHLTGQVLDLLARDAQPRVYLLWGKPAQKAAAAIAAPPNLKLEAPHPSPLSAYRGFFGARPFSRANNWLQTQGLATINWTDPTAS
ncbi:uracil-DNA glycosylase [Nioella nitratireducens]|uniref:uracil-DNA glycosylase n=1 Tax=Nioella nitratireducens TaxID=1287720 RepID=UPI001F3796EA|nr:uracil-DNA glycosylase [Nioella nitratireducens]